MSMKTIADRSGYPDVFGVERDYGGLRLNGRWAKLSDRWGPENRFAFSLPQVTNAQPLCSTGLIPLTLCLLYKGKCGFCNLYVFQPSTNNIQYQGKIET